MSIWIRGGGADGGKNAGILDANRRFDAFNPLDPEGIGDFGEEGVEATAIVEAGEGEGGDDLGGAVLGLEGGKVGVWLSRGGELQKRASGEAADVGVFILKHGEESGNRAGVGPASEKASGGGTGEPVGILRCLAKERGGLGGGENAGGFDGFAANGGIGIAQGVFQDAGG